jgi:rhodanese-related sulfurtransferase
MTVPLTQHRGMQREPAVPAISPEEASLRIGDGAVLLDVREPDEWSAGHAPTAVHVPLAALAANVDTFDKKTPIIAVCRVGGRSERAAGLLLQRGFDAVNLAGGMQAWEAATLPVVTDSGEEGQVV